MDKFDKIIKESVEGYEAPYDAQAWANVSAQLGNKGGAMKWIVGSAAAVVLLTGTVYLMQDQNTPPVSEVVAENTITGDHTTTENPIVVDQSSTVTENVGVADGTTNTVPENGSTVNHSGNSGNDGNSSETTANHVSDNSGNEGNHNVNHGNDHHAVDGNESNHGFENAESISSAKVNPKFTPDLSTACVNSEFIFTPEDMNQTALYVWEFGDGSFSSSKLGVHTYKNAGTYTVSLSIKDSKTNRTLSKSTMEVTANPLPDVQFAWEKSNEMIPAVSFINLTEDAEEWTWDIKGLKTSRENQFEYTFRKKGTYIVELTASNEFNCVNSLQKPLEVKSDYNLLAPTAFTPNGDNKNDYFIPEALRLMDVAFTMVVYDKTGNIMYQTNSVNQPWDGTNTNDNSIADDGAYVWTVQFKNAGGEIEYYEGQVIITR